MIRLRNPGLNGTICLASIDDVLRGSHHLETRDDVFSKLPIGWTSVRSTTTGR